MHPEVETAVSERLAQLRAQVQQQAMQISHLTTVIKGLLIAREVAAATDVGPVILTREQLERAATFEIVFRDVDDDGIELELP